MFTKSNSTLEFCNICVFKHILLPDSLLTTTFTEIVGSLELDTVKVNSRGVDK